VHDRKKNLIISGGENIYPAEVERVLLEHSDVAECGVIGRPDARWDEVPVAYVIRRKGGSVDAAGLQAHIQSQLARFKVPREIVFVEDLAANRAGEGSAFLAESDRRKDACGGETSREDRGSGRRATARLRPRGILRCRAMTCGYGGATPSRSLRIRRQVRVSW